MLSRRNIRVKIMQTLYASKLNEGIGLNEAIVYYDQLINDAFQILKLHLKILAETICHAKEDLSRRNVKLLPNDFDKIFTLKLMQNEVSQSLINNKILHFFWKKDNFKEKIPEDLTKKLYRSLASSQEYISYIKSETNIEDDKKILLFFYKEFIKNEYFDETIEDLFFNWLDDESIIIGAMKKIIKSLPDDIDFGGEFRRNPETVDEFGKDLLKQVLIHDEELDQRVRPFLVNWELDRIAEIDKIIIKLAICEMLYFPTIPTKVTLNEYLELTKLYSNEKSKEFINGILDKILKNLEETKTLKKEGRGLIE